MAPDPAATRIRWAFMVAWLWISKPCWMAEQRRKAAHYREHGIPVLPHTFGGADDV